MTRSGPLSEVKALMHHMADRLRHAPVRPPAREVVRMQILMAATGQRRAQPQPAQMPVRAKHPDRGLRQQRMLTARPEIGSDNPSFVCTTPLSPTSWSGLASQAIRIR